MINMFLYALSLSRYYLALLHSTMVGERCRCRSRRMSLVVRTSASCESVWIRFDRKSPTSCIFSLSSRQVDVRRCIALIRQLHWLPVHQRVMFKMRGSYVSHSLERLQRTSLTTVAFCLMLVIARCSPVPMTCRSCTAANT